ncbi:MAG: amidohydrolase family protein [Armatimonadota bacterium]
MLPEFIDVHLHVGRLYTLDEGPITAEMAIGFMDRAGIEKAALLPIESPEEAHFYVTTEEVLATCARYPDRLIPFCNVDPRIGSGDNSSTIYARLKEYKERGCKGFGEAMSGLFIDDIRLQRTYAACGELGLPIIYHIDADRNIDEKGFLRLERMLQQFPDTIFVGHGQHFWAEISAHVTPEQFTSYPHGPVGEEGAVFHLLEAYPNMYADLSAGSAYNAITRDPDPDFGPRFLQRFAHKLFFGTDACRVPYFAEMPGIATYLRKMAEDGKLSEPAFRAISRENAERVFGL